MNKKAHVSESKKKIVEELLKLCKEYSIIGLLNMENLPAKQLQKINEKLRGDVVLRMAKKRIINIAFDRLKEEKKGIEKLNEYFKGMPALIFTNKDPFGLFKTLKKNRSNAPAKPGQIAPSDLKVKAGPTPFAPGPVIGELGMVGIKTKVEGNKIHITEDAVIVKEGEEIKENVAGILSRLDVKPIEVGLELVAIYEKGKILTKDILDIDEEAYINQLSFAHSEAYKLALELYYPIEEVINVVLGRMHYDALTIAREQEIITDETKEDLLRKAAVSANNLKKNVPEDVKEEETDEKSEEKEGGKPTEGEKAEDKEAKKEEKKPVEKEEKAEEVKEEKEEETEEVKEEKKEEDKSEEKEEKDKGK